jgi:hypothetical protein
MILERSSCAGLLRFLLKKTSDLVKFISWPDAVSYVLRIVIRELVSVMVDLQNKKQSSAKRR